MKLLSVNLARSVWQIHMDDLNPGGRRVGPYLAPFLVDIFKFEQYPRTPEERNNPQGIVFDGGEFKNKNGELIKVKLVLLSFGLVAETQSSTADSDYFLETALEKMHDNFNIANYKDALRAKNYFGQLYFSTNKSLKLINPKLKEISDYLSNNTSGHGELQYELGGIHFWPDQINPAGGLPIFTVERQINIPFAENRYFSASGLETEKHIKLLERLEEIL